MTRTLIDRHTVATYKNRNLDHMIVELGPHMTELEMDQAVDLLNTLAKSEFDINMTVDDAAIQLRILFGAERYEMIKAAWSAKNQHLIKDGVKKYRRLSDGTIWDGLDPTDNPNDYQELYL